ncbi:MAG: hypothetical protein K8T20_14265 [Planctomycetes bacterium]|nr:hypothetical protein [Planctomycetota bacterium]
MFRLLAVLLLAAPLCGCRVFAHSFERETLEHRTVIESEMLSESWNPPTGPALTVEPGLDGLRIVATAHQTGTQHVRVRERVHIEDRCARRAVAGIFEAPDSFWGVCDDVWVAFSFLGAFLFTHYEGDINDPVVLAFIALGVVPMAIDAITFIPWWIAGHDWNGPCDYVAESREEPELTEERDEPAERDVPLAGGEVAVHLAGGAPVARISCGADGLGAARFRDVVAWSKGSSADLVFEVSAGGKDTSVAVPPGAVLNGPSGTPVDWRAPRGSVGAPELAATARVEGATLVIVVENRGKGDAWQVAAILASDNPAADGRVAALGRLHPGERVEAHINLPAGTTRGALDFSEAFGRSPAAIPFGE